MTPLIKHVSILIPARNEEKLISACLESILTACDHLKNNITTDIILIVDASKDNTYIIGKNLLGNRGIVIQSDNANVGSARKTAALIALARYKETHHLNQCWLANTDADCIVPSHWLYNQLNYAEQNIQAIAGIVKVDSFAEHDHTVKEKFNEIYSINTDSSHPHVHGANIGFRADAYTKVGGWRELETAEDHDLWNRFTQFEIPKISNATIWVYTSGRRIGRAPHGFAGKLISLSENTK